MRQQPLRAALLGAGLLLLAACNQATLQNSSKAPPPPPEVAVIEVHPQSVPLSRELVGRLAPTRVAQVRARVAGIILERVYTEGTDVSQGEVLYLIDPAPLEAALHAKEAALAKAEADASNAAATAKRSRKLEAKKLIANQDLDDAIATERSTAAAVKQAQADVESARLNLGYATVTAPIAGRAGRALVTEGALVGQGEATQLTTIEQIDPIYVNFSLSVSEFRELQSHAGGPGAARVEVELPDGKPYPQAGTLDFSDLDVDPGTGAISLRAVLPNPDHSLLPGMFVNLRLTTGTIDQAFVLPQTALARDAKGAYALVVGADGKVAQRRLEARGMTRSDWIVTGDLADGDQVIVEGLQKVQPGTTASTVPAAQPTAETAAKH
ncbi:MAG: efflux RND transporter periplasmic adaptor subunit [Gammaproteobacteria bacterium]|jgi:membrane fusion protein (multidrug efflux system)|nr:efflux RND transporter periplasmic adaptor subunit [Gammaproteobacteria bacterium]